MSSALLAQALSLSLASLSFPFLRASLLLPAAQSTPVQTPSESWDPASSHGPTSPSPGLTFLLTVVRDLPEVCPGVSAPEREGARGGERQLFFCQPVTSRVRPGHSLPRPRTGNRWTSLRPRWGWPRGGPGLGIGRRTVGWEGLSPEFPGWQSRGPHWLSGCFGTRQSMGACCCGLKTVPSPSASLLGCRVRCYNERPQKMIV